MRERDQTHSYWYITSAPRVNYSLLVIESARMMKMSTGEGSPFGRVPEQASKGFWWLQRLAAAEFPIYLVLQWF